MRKHPVRTHPYAVPDAQALKRRNRLLILLVLVLLLVLMMYNRRQERQVGLALQRQAVEDAFLEIGGALERYRVDQGGYPIEAPGVYPAAQLARLTTPHPYLWNKEVLQDPFAEDGYRIGMLDTQPPRWLLISAGPNQQWELLELPRETAQGEQKLRESISRVQYDPTNGSTSDGDILSLGKQR